SSKDRSIASYIAMKRTVVVSSLQNSQNVIEERQGCQNARTWSSFEGPARPTSYRYDGATPSGSCRSSCWSGGIVVPPAAGLLNPRLLTGNPAGCSALSAARAGW